MAKKITQSLDTLKDVIRIVDQMGDSVSSLEGRVRALNSEFKVAQQLTGHSGSNTTAPIMTQTNTQATLVSGPNNSTVPSPQHLSTSPPPAINATAPFNSMPLYGPSGLAVSSVALNPFVQNPLMQAPGQQGPGSPLAATATSLTSLTSALGQTNQTLNNLAQSIQNLVNQQGGQPSQGRGGPGSPQPNQPAGIDVKSLVQQLSTVAGVGASAYDLMLKADIMMKQASVGANRRAEEAEGHISGEYARRKLEAIDLTNPENLVKYRSDILFPGRYKYLGDSGFQRAMSEAGGETGQQINLLKAQAHEQAVMGGVTAGLGLLGVAGGAALMGTGAGAALGIPMMAAGMQGLISGGQGLLSSFNSPYDQLTHGGLSGTFLGRMMNPNAELESMEIKKAASAQMALEQLEKAERLQKADMERAQLDVAGAEMVQQAVDVRKRGTLLVGQYARGGYENIPDSAKIVAEQTQIDLKYHPEEGGGPGAAVPQTFTGPFAKKEAAIADKEKLLAAREAQLKPLLEAKSADEAEQKAFSARQQSLLAAGRSGGGTTVSVKTDGVVTSREMIRSEDEAAFNEVQDLSTKVSQRAKKRQDQIDLLNTQISNEKNIVEGYRSKLDYAKAKANEEGSTSSAAASPTTSSEKDWRYYQHVIDQFETKGPTDSARYSAENADTHAYGRYQIMKRYHRNAFENLIGKPYDEAIKVPENQDRYFREALLPQYKREAAETMKQKPSLTEDEAIALQQLGHQNLTDIFTGRAQPWQMQKVAPQIAGILKRVDASQGRQFNTAAVSDDSYSESNSTAVSKAARTVLTRVPKTAEEMGQDYGMTEPEFMDYRNRMLNFVAPSQTYDWSSGKPRIVGDEHQNLQNAYSMVRLERAGVGSFDQLLGNLGGLNRVAGGQNNIEKLDQIMANAVAIGFDRSRNAQMFVQGVTSLADKIGTQNTGEVSDALALTSYRMSNDLSSGRADERGLAAAEKGMARYEQISAGTSGTLGMMKMIGQANIPSDLGTKKLVSEMGTMETLSSLKLLHLSDNMGLADIKDKKLRAVVGGFDGSSVKEQAQNAIRSLQANLGSENKASDSMVRQYSSRNGRVGINYDDEVAKIKSLAPGQRQEALLKLEGTYARALSVTRGMDFDTAEAATWERLRQDSGLVSSIGGQGALETAKDRGRVLSVDAAETTRANAKDQLGVLTSAFFSAPVSKEEISKVLNRKGAASSVVHLTTDKKKEDGSLETLDLTGEMYDKYTSGKLKDPSQVRAIQTWERGLNRGSFAKSMKAEDILMQSNNSGIKIADASATAIGLAVADAMKNYSKAGLVANAAAGTKPGGQAHK